MGNGIGIVGHECGQSCWVVEDHGGIGVVQTARNRQRPSGLGVDVSPELAVVERGVGNHQIDSGGVNGIGRGRCQLFSQRHGCFDPLWAEKWVRPHPGTVGHTATSARETGNWGGTIRFGMGQQRITRAECAHVAALARLELTDEELDRFTGQLDELLDHVAEVEALDLEELEPTMHALPIANLLRPDTPGEVLDRDEVLGQAPFAEDGQFRVPPVLGEAP